MNYVKKAIQGTVIILIFHLGANLISYLLRMLLARNLTPAEYGLFYSVFTFVLFFLFFRNLGLGSALVKFIPEYKIKKDFNKIKTAITSVISMQLLSSIIFSLVFFILSNYLAEHYFQNQLASPILRYLILYIIFSIFYVIQRNILQGFQSMFLFATTEFMKSTVVLILIYTLFQFYQGPFVPVIAYALVCPILIILYAPFNLKLTKFFKSKIKNYKITSKQLLLFGIPVFATSFGSKIIGYIDTLILTYYTTLTDVGIYNVILPSSLILLFIGTAVSQVIFPMSSELWAKKDKKRLAQGLSLLYRYSFILAIPIIFTVFTFSEFLITLFFSAEYAVGYKAFQILLIGVLFYIVAIINNNVISGIGNPKTVTKIILTSAILNVILNLILIPKFSIIGAAIATTTSYLLTLILSTYKATKFIQTKPPYKDWFKILLAAILFIIIITNLSNKTSNIWLNIIISAISASFFYLIFIYITKTINIKEIKSYCNILKK